MSVSIVILCIVVNEENEGLNDPVDLEGTENVENANRLVK